MLTDEIQPAGGHALHQEAADTIGIAL